MRELDRVKDKIEIRLDPRQVVTLGVATTVFCGALFAAGFFVGRKQARPPAAEPTNLAALDAAARAVRDDARGGGTPSPALGDVEFLFPAVVAAGPGRGPEQAPVRVPALVVQPEPEPGTRPEPAVAAEPVAPVERAPAVEPMRAVPPAVAPPRPEVLPPSAPARRAAEPPPPPDELEAPRAPARPSAAVPPPPDEDEPKPGAAPGPGSSTSGQAATFTLQVKAAREKSEADAVAEKLRKAGFEPSLIVADVPGKGRVYRVRVGRFESVEKARAFQRRLKAESGLPDAGFVTDL